ncbi:LysR family transcriptional regulator [Paenibacillus sp. YN15]|uniref:LysR family transcriptional regulator n=1 Tax=Paenibacillus sp. YN15 TaxID=1742774 RepID=UPI000DCB3B67|nr:LysR family transcriptional regulator [Paenibacillus sp. YN15]RAV02638.1 LysR family transcriptional regulator [Paenibacillus sp. YN15]
MEWQQLEYFQTVARLQHFTRAAEELSISQPALSRSIANLEAELGMPLFDRQGRSVRLNRYGERFAVRVGRALAEIREGKEELAHWLDPDYGTVALIFLKSLGISAVPSLLSEFAQHWPNIRFRLDQQSTHEMLDRLERGEVDFILSSMTETRSGVQWRSLWEEVLYAYVPHGHRLAGCTEIHIADMAEEPFIALKTGYGMRTIAERLFEQEKATPNIVFEGDDVMTVVGFVSAGLGVSLLPAIPSLELDKVSRLPIANPECRRTIGLAWRTEGYLSPPAERFRAFLLERFERA